ncbi:related to N-glycosyltransferase [Cephalotrichum gorgonifer]|uniref:Related to N-glycosyltransferase n=1 Tax=Cephalotrichum gorgonifer TaxID=2041049 RepID=A0AAE8MZQ3_9PEZI|nr:related to N-glycosyltransferase [Cephalotrichum gorgonifer]
MAATPTTLSPQPKPLLIFAAPSAYGHTAHLLPHAAHLTSRGYEVYFLGGPQFASAIARTGATFVETPNTWPPEALSDSANVPPGQTPFLWEQRRLFVDSAPLAARSLAALLEDVRARHPRREVVIIEEMLFMGTWPFVLGAPLPRGYDRFPRVISFSSFPIWVSSRDTAPFGAGLPPDSSAEGRERNVRLYEALEAEQSSLMDHANAIYVSLGATEKIATHRNGDGMVPSMLDVWAGRPAVTVYPCSPSLEYHRSDLPPNTRFIGGAPRPDLGPSTVLPGWWGELLANKSAEGPEKKKVVFVTQGTVVSNFDNLVKPVLEGLADREDVLVVAVLGARGATLGDFDTPRNARVQDYLLYHAVLPFADVFISNGGYGGFMQAVMYGVPMVLAGTTQDKAEVSMRGEWAGIAVNLRTDTPTREAVRAGVDWVLGDTRFKTRAREIRRENEELNSLGRLEEIIAEVAE